MRDAHLKLNLKENHFNVVARILRETLLEIGVNEKITDSIMNKIAGLKNDVLNI
jgi:truncated hemoglobin YjbI